MGCENSDGATMRRVVVEAGGMVVVCICVLVCVFVCVRVYVCLYVFVCVCV